MPPAAGAASYQSVQGLQSAGKLDRRLDGHHHVVAGATLNILVFVLPDHTGELKASGEHAVDRYDWRKGFKFSTYATWWVRQAITQAIEGPRPGKDPI